MIRHPHDSDIEHAGKAFRGVNDKRISYREEGACLIDSLDVGLYGEITTASANGALEAMYRDNASFWMDVFAGRLRHGDAVRLEGFDFLEWLPAAPGRYFTTEAATAREYAREFFSWTDREYLPLGKMEMVLGGVGSVRLAPKELPSGRVCFFGASSTGISHQGVPIVCPAEVGKRILRAIRRTGGVIVSLRGTLWPLPLDRSPVKFDRGIPKNFLFAEEICTLGESHPSRLLVTVAITYNSTYEGGDGVDLGDLRFKSSKNWSFASFNPAQEQTTLKEAVKWLGQYTIRHAWRDAPKKLHADYVPIFSDFDQTCDHFDNAIEFPLTEMMRGNYDRRLLKLYGAEVPGFVINEAVFGDKFENINNSSIVNRSMLSD